MRVIGSIQDPSVIRDILDHLGIWLVRSRPPPKTHDPPVCILKAGRPDTPTLAHRKQCLIKSQHLLKEVYEKIKILMEAPTL